MIKEIRKNKKRGREAVGICDYCSKNIIKPYYKNIENRRNFCNRQCQNLANKKDGLLYRDIQDTCMKKYGVKDYMSSEDFKNKSKETNLIRYGFENAYQSEEVKARGRETIRKNWGVDNPGQSLTVRAKVIDTVRARYGVDNVYQTDFVKEKKILSYQEHYGEGITNPGQAKEVRKKVKNTLNERYNVDSALQLPQTREACNSPEACAKRHKNMKERGTYWKSKPEDMLYGVLCDFFTSLDIERQPYVNNCWPIDFYIKSLDIYIQLDGVYWHGLNRPLDVIKASQTKRDKAILHKYETDLRQNMWFEENNLRLVRITDREFLQENNLIFRKLLDDFMPSNPMAANLDETMENI